MNTRDLDQKVKAITKAIGREDDHETALTLLKSLVDDSAPTEEMLRATKAGVTIGRLRSHQNKEIGSRATQLVNKWKKNIDQQKKAKQQQKTGSPTPSSLADPATPQGLGAPATSTTTHTPKMFTGDPEKRSARADGMEKRIAATTDSKARTNCLTLMYNGLAYRSTADCDAVFFKAVAVEDAAYRHYKGETGDYRKKMGSLFQNLKVKGNADLGRRVMAGDIAADRFIVMSRDELMSAERRRENEELEKQNMKNAQVPQAEKSVTSEFKCTKCGERKVSYNQAQTRSADEPMTTFCECTVCGNRWKFS